MRFASMPIKVRVYGGEPPQAGEDAPAITLDGPRIVLGRGEGCEVRLPDRSVTARHASIRQRGTDYVLVDEGSTNGTRMGSVVLAPHAPRVLGPKETVRLGRIFVVIEKTHEPPTLAAPARAKELALGTIARSLEEEGVDPRPQVRVTDGPDSGITRALDSGAIIVVGRARDADICVTDESASRRHIEIANVGESLVVRDLGSRGGAAIDGTEIGSRDTPWKRGQRLEVGANVFEWSFPALDELANLEKMPDEKVSASALAVSDAVEIVAEDPSLDEFEDDGAPLEEPEDAELSADMAAREAAIEHEERAARRGSWGLTDFAVLLLAIGVFSLSAVGYVVLLR
ncbi:MAG: FHA domain-containing protein [Polyangiaceae bacterium]